MAAARVGVPPAQSQLAVDTTVALQRCPRALTLKEHTPHVPWSRHAPLGECSYCRSAVVSCIGATRGLQALGARPSQPTGLRKGFTNWDGLQLSGTATGVEDYSLEPMHVIQELVWAEERHSALSGAQWSIPIIESICIVPMQLSITPGIQKLLQDSCRDDTLAPVSACALHDASSMLPDAPEDDHHAACRT